MLYALAIENRIEPNHYYAFMNAYGHVNSAFAALAGIAISVAAIPPVLEMAEPILQAEPEVSEKREAVTGVSGSIEISHVSFRYEENRNYILTDMNLKIGAGEYVAIVGRTGCGKSTLVRLMLGFEQPETAGGSLAGGGNRRHRGGHPEDAHGDADDHRRGPGGHFRRPEAAPDDRPGHRAQAEDSDL